ncbi:uncharacterized protein MONBRDRAFT_9713 [Monosiga brevicollis MX1]|uniref:CWH43-like N-terminal domain-containing protein n=1 Tax=Monosiga brevicollis TaxID=81824 RepID=A9V3J6_MONBE|nr:uncharacterized protein MONBRDRAFT_9713 [Monosiga brevicollis MX1]EDQ87825.1 predicted protein [Monosiga brevicollis MX1]|eukprot:XP_001747358.1 hypothetical protein [Monosiga brevicollis MX1]
MAILQREVTKVDQFVFATLEASELLFWGSGDSDVALREGVLRTITGDFDILDPTVHGNAEAETLLHAFVTLQERVEALRRFVLINRASLTKILKKYLRRLGSGANATNNFNETPEERPVAKNPKAAQVKQSSLAFHDLLSVSSNFTIRFSRLKLDFQRMALRLAVLTLPVLRAIASHVGTLGLSCSCIALILVIVVRHKSWVLAPFRWAEIAIERLLLFSDQNGTLVSIYMSIRLSRFNHVLHCRALVMSQRHLHGIGHNVFAVLFFTVGVCHTTIECYLDARFKLSTPWTLRLRRSIVGFTALCVVIFLTFLYLGAHHWEQRDMNLLLIAAIAEIAALFSFLLYFCTYLSDFAHAMIYVVIIERRRRQATATPSLAEFKDMGAASKEKSRQKSSATAERRNLSHKALGVAQRVLAQKNKQNHLGGGSKAKAN